MKTSSEWMESILVSNQQKPFSAWAMESCKVVLTLESVDKMMWGAHWNETSLPILSHGATVESPCFNSNHC